MSFLVGFVPWSVYWVLVGNVPPIVAALIALAFAVAVVILGRRAPLADRTVELGALATFLVVTVLTIAFGLPSARSWLLPLSYAAVLVVTLTGVLIGKPFTARFTDVLTPQGLAKSALFDTLTKRLAWLWIATFAAMTISAAIPPIVHSEAGTPLSYICFWVIPFVLVGLAALATHELTEQTLAGIDDAVRETTFVAYGEATIDELYYLAQEHANREVGAGQEAYSVKVGGTGTPLVGDDARNSWPSTYKVRNKR